MFYVILNTRTNVKFHKSNTKLRVFEARLFVMDAAQQSSTHRCFLRTGLVGLEAADGGKHACPESGLQIAENPLRRGASRD